MILRKRLLGSAPVQTAMAWLIVGYIRLVHATSRWDHEGLEHLRAVRDSGQPLIGCFWHQRIMMMRFLWREPVPFSVLVSPHRDGRLLSRAMRLLGVGIIEGSSNREGTAGLRAVIRALKDGHAIGITPDGPRGPRQRVQGGVITAARAAGAVILPAAFSVRRHRLLGTWDRFLVALPFTRGVYVIGAPLAVTELEPERARLMLEERLNELTHYADRLIGIAPIEPATEPAVAHTVDG